MSAVKCPTGHEVPEGNAFCGVCGDAVAVAETDASTTRSRSLRDVLLRRGPAVTGVLGAAIIIAIVGTVSWNSWITSRLLDDFEAALIVDELVAAQSVVAQMNAKDPDELRFSDAEARLEALLTSQSHFTAGQRALERGEYREAFSEFSLVAESDTARFADAAASAVTAQSLFESEVLAEADALIESDPRQAFWTIKNESDFLLETDAVTQAMERAVAQTTANVDAELRALVDNGNYIGAAKLRMQTSDALLEYGEQFQQKTQWFADRFEQEKASALSRVYSWEGGPDAATRYFDRAAVRYVRAGDDIRWITADALELHIYENPDALSLYLKAMLYHPQWVMADTVVATIDGETWDLGFPVDAIERYEGDRNKWEGAWRVVVPADVDFLIAMALSQRTTIEFSGPDDSASFSLNAADKAGLQNMLLAYFALGADPRALW